MSKIYLTISFIIFLSLSLLFGLEPHYKSGYLTYNFSKIQDKYNIIIMTDVTNMIPDLWNDGPFYGYASPLKENNYTKTLKILDRALNEYPDYILTNNLIEIGICDSLSFYKTNYASTMICKNNHLRIILSINDSTTITEGVNKFHYEFFRILYEKNKFPDARWKALNKPGFRYKNNALGDLQDSSATMRLTDASLQDGFICEYAKNDLVIDIAKVAQYAIGEKTNFIKYCLNYPIVNLKYKLLNEFYYQISKYFDADFWTGKKIHLRFVNDYINDPKDPSYLSLQFYAHHEPNHFITTFKAKESSKIGYNLRLKKSESDLINIESVYYYPDQTIMGFFTKQFNFSPNKSTITCKALFGWDDPGYWEAGKYSVIFYINKRYLSTEKFIMD